MIRRILTFFLLFCPSLAAQIVPSSGGTAVAAPLPLTLATLDQRFNRAFLNVPYSDAVVASGGTAPYTYTLTGSLPTGITQSGSCVGIAGQCLFTGTPTVSGTFPLSFLVTDSSTPAQVASIPGGVSIVVDTLASATISPTGQSIQVNGTLQMSLTPVWTTFGSIPDGSGSDLTNLVTWSCTGTGCSSVSASGLFTASASAGTPTVNVAAFDGITPTGVTVTVLSNATNPTFTTTALTNGQINQPYAETVVGPPAVSAGSGAQTNCSGGSGAPFTFTNVGADLPAGLTLNTSTGLITGTATASGTTTSHFSCTDSGAHTSATVAVPIVIASVSSIAVTPATPSITVGAQQPFTATATYSDSSTHDVTVGTVGGVVSWSHGASANAGNTLANSTTNSVTLSTVPAGSIIVCGLDDVTGGGVSETLNSVKDQNNNSFTITPQSPTTYTTNIGMNWVAYNLSALTGTNTITGTWSASNFNFLGCDSFLPSGGTAAFDTGVATTNAASSTTVSSPSITPAASGELLYNSTDTAGTITSANSPWLLASGATFAGGVANEYILSSGSGAQSSAYTQATGGGAYSGISAAFSITAAAGSGTVWTATDVAPGHNVASVTASGLATCISGGSSTIKAAIGGVNGTATLTCNAVATDTALIISPPSSTVSNLGFTTYRVTGNKTGNDLTATSTFASDNVNIVSMNGAGPGNNIGTCKVTNGGSANVSASNPANGGIASPKALQTCIALGTASLLNGCVVTGTNEASTGSVSSCNSTFPPAGWTFVKAQTYAALASGEFSDGGAIETTQAHTPTQGWGSLFKGDGFTDAWGFNPSMGTDLYVSTWVFWDANAHIEVGNAFLFRLSCGTCGGPTGGKFQEFLVNFDNFGKQVSMSPTVSSSTAAQGLTLDYSPQGVFSPPQFSTKGYDIHGGTWEQEEFWFHPNTCTGGVANADGFARVYINGTLFIDAENKNLVGCVTASALLLRVGGQTDSQCVENASNQCVGPAGIAIPAGGHQQRCNPYTICPALEADGVTPCVQQNTWNRYHDDTIVLKK